MQFVKTFLFENNPLYGSYSFVQLKISYLPIFAIPDCTCNGPGLDFHQQTSLIM